MKLKKYFYILLSLFYFDIVFNIFAYDTYLRSSIFNMVVFAFINASIIYIVTSIFKDKITKILLYVIYAFLWFWYSLYYVFYKVFITPFSIALFRQTDQVMTFGKSVIIAILSNIHVVLLFLVPLIMIIIFRKKIEIDKFKIKNLFKGLAILAISIGLFFLNMLVTPKDYGSIHSLYYDTNNVALNIERLGVLQATYLDIKRAIFGFNEKIVEVDTTISEDNESLFVYDDNKLDLEFPTGSSNINMISNYMKNDTPTKKNKYTGMFQGKNLVFIVAESFSEIAVSKELTPTLYKLVHEGFDFTNFYTSNNLSTIGGEFQALTGLYADNSILSNWRRGSAYFPYGLGTVFKGLGYNTFAYHNNSAYFQDRNVYLKSQGFDNYKGCYNGMEKIINCKQWPQSDMEMMDATSSDYLNSDKPFMAYYMTVSGHFYYDFATNAMARKHKNDVKDLDYPEEVKGYVATQIELDKALELLIKKLEDAKKLDDTVFVLLADHYPYYLPLNYINKLSTYQRDSLIEANSNNLIIYNSKMKPVKVDKVGMSIDVIPTVFNLFGVDYDSRVIMGKDILSDNVGIAIFKDKSWVSDKGTYRASTGKFSKSVDDIPDDYVNTINNIVNNRVAISRMIVQNNYYKYLFKK